MARNIILYDDPELRENLPLVTLSVAASTVASGWMNIFGVPSGKHGSPMSVQVLLNGADVAVRAIVI